MPVKTLNRGEEGADSRDGKLSVGTVDKLPLRLSL